MFDFYKLRQNKIHKFKAKVELHSERSQFIIKTVTNSDELIQALRLRYEVFHHEMIGKSKTSGIDVDEFDFQCDHLIIQEKKSRQIVGTYRLNCSLFNQQFYSGNEFNLRRILENPGIKLELGRACIHKNHRKGMVISLLWRGIAEYMAATQSDLLFGCASVKTESARQAALLYHHFQRDDRFAENFFAPPSLDYQMPGLSLWIQFMNRPFTLDEISEIEALIPPLCRAYLKIGAKIGGEPAYDKEFKCIDFLTILPRENLNRALWKKYNFSESTASLDNSSCQVMSF